MTWMWNDDTREVTQIGDTLIGRPKPPQMHRDQDYDHGGVFLFEDDFAALVMFRGPGIYRDTDLTTAFSYDAQDRLIVTCGGFTSTRFALGGRTLTVSERFDDLDRQRRYLNALPAIVAAVPQIVMLPPGIAPRGAQTILRTPSAKDGGGTQYSRFLLPDPGS